MKTRTAMTLVAVASLLFVFIVAVERQSSTTRDKEIRADRIFQELRRDFIDHISVAFPDGTTVAVMRLPSDSSSTAPRWQLAGPAPLPAEGGEVRGMLSALDFLIRLRTISGDITETKYGFQTPRLACSFTARGETTHFFLGGDTPDGKIYLALDGVTDEFYVVEKDILTALSKRVEDLRDPHLLFDVIDDASQIVITGDDVRHHLKRDPTGSLFRVLRNDTWILANSKAIGEVLHGIRELKALQFVADDIDETQFEEYGLIEPHRTIALTVGQREITLRVGAPCSAGSTNRYATLIGSGSVACVGHEFATLLSRPVERYLEHRLVTARPDDITRLVVEEPARKATLDLSRRGGAWFAEGRPEVAIDSQTVGKLLEALAGVQALEVIDGPPVAPGPKPRVAVQIFTQDEAVPRTLEFFQTKNERAAVRRDEENATLIIPGDLLDDLGADLLRYLDRTIRHGAKAQVVSITIEGPVDQKLTMDGNRWMIREPITVAADGSAASTLAGLLTALTVERYSTQSGNAAGFNTPFIRLSFEQVVTEQHGDHLDQTGSQTVVLELGALSPRGHRYGRFVDDGVIFEIGDEIETLVANPLIARDLLQLPSTKIESVALTAGTSTVHFERKGSSWLSSTGQKFNTDRLERLLTDLSAVRTVGAVSFDKDSASVGPVQLKIVATMRSDAASQQEPKSTATITVGARAQNDRGYLAISDGAQAVFILPERLADELIDFVSSTS